jgi:transposase
VPDLRPPETESDFYFVQARLDDCIAGVRGIALAARRQGPNDRKFLEALHYFLVHNITWRALPEKFGHWNSVWNRFWRVSRSGTLEAFFDALAAMSDTWYAPCLTGQVAGCAKH